MSLLSPTFIKTAITNTNKFFFHFVQDHVSKRKSLVSSGLPGSEVRVSRMTVPGTPFLGSLCNSR